MPAQEKIVSLFEPHTRILQRRKTGVPIEFGRHVVLDEVEGGIVTALPHPRPRVRANTPSCRQPWPTIGRSLGIRRSWWPAIAGSMSRPSRRQRSSRQESSTWWCRGKGRPRPSAGRWNTAGRGGGAIAGGRASRGVFTACAGTTGSSAVRDHGEVGMERRVGWGILASNLWHIGQACAKRAGKAA